MKRVILISAAALAATFISFSCQKEEQTGDNPGKGEILTVTASIGDVCQDTKTYIDGTESSIKTYWSEGDKIKLFDDKGNTATYRIKDWKVKQTSAVFVLDDGQTALTGTFQCACYPADGASLDGINIIFSLPSTQSYVGGTGKNAGSFGNGAAPMVGTGTLDTTKGNLDLTFKNACGALQLNLTSSEVITRIDVAKLKGYLCGKATVVKENEQPVCVLDGTYTCYSQVSMADTTAEVSKDTPRAYYLVLPQMETATLRIAVTTESGLYYGDIKTAITCGKITCMAAKDVSKLTRVTYSEKPDSTPVMIGGNIWAPVNCGYGMHKGGSASEDPVLYSYGLLYQWGRLHGGGYNDSKSFTEEKMQTADKGPVKNAVPDSSTFVFVTDEPLNWYAGENPDPNTLWQESKTTYDPCPEGWRVPTSAELKSLIGNSEQAISGGWDKTNGGYWFNGTETPKEGDGLFLPAAGYLDRSSGKAQYRTENGYYWSSTVSTERAQCLYFHCNGSAMMSTTQPRAWGSSVRCVKE